LGLKKKNDMEEEKARRAESRSRLAERAAFFNSQSSLN
jgi:hypothetical protein